MGSLQVHEQRLNEKTKTVEEAFQSQLVLQDEKKAVENQKNVWYLDTGCSNHMCGVKELFSKLDGSFRSEVKFGNNSKLVEHGYHMEIKDGYCTIWDSKLGLITKKSDTLEAFKEFKAYVEKESGHQIWTLRTDRGMEYLVGDNFFKKNGIKHQLTARNTPQQNGVAERKNHTIVDMVRTILRAKHLPKHFWVKAIICVVYLLNRCPTKGLEQLKIPVEVWSGQTPSVNHFRVLRCIASAHVPDELCKKLDDKSEKYIFLGYSDVTKGYRLFNPMTKKVIINRDVTFDEDAE
ncbi:hypothetical protein CRG98_007623 [Punica granatum]|uniref:Integrase catalytic domain-containing protein n=1 Tax=Punica granatum TaxID=22663 RepID=A0A2I0KU55_PUNGR|nr:hypothetical protein CRG98_007623 [Punica granatum]